ncbi:MAG TPA: hypothetical protein VLH86_01095 [Patescibacteria group bacterium]|nr:hypothetical protein [Patescibacteria group bacterium]
MTSLGRTIVGGINQETGEVTAMGFGLAVARALTEQAEPLAHHYGSWRIRRATLAATAAVQDQIPAFLDEFGDEETDLLEDIGSGVDDIIGVRALALQAARHEDDVTRREAADILVYEVGPEQAIAMIDAAQVTERSMPAWVGSLVQAVAAPVMAVVPLFSTKLQ